MVLNVAVNPQGISVIQNMMSTNPTPEIAEGATSGKTNICKNFINNEFRWKICICIYVKNGK